jgi:hypothetical protein
MAHRPDSRTSAASNFLIRHSSVRTMGDERPDGYSSSRNFHIGNACVRTMIGKRPDGHIWIAILALKRRASGRLIDLPFLGTWKEIRNWSSTGRRPDVLLKRPDGCKLAQKLLDTLWGPDRMNTSSRRMMLVCLASGRDGSIVRMADRELEFFWLANSE